MEPDGNYGFHTIEALLGWGEESWSLVHMQLDSKVYLHIHLYSKLFNDTVSEVRNSLRVSSLGVQDH